ncbi:MAG: hypothetical protein M3406_08205 [Chloroflexota bacterium]|nr:hypothetical protein [Chloroflexota bacterium]
MTDHRPSTEEQDRRRTRRELRAGIYQTNPELEHLEKHPELLDAMSTADAADMRMRLGYYRRDRNAATLSDEEFTDDAA